MSARTLTMTDPLYDYLLSVNRPLPDLFARLRAETLQLPMAMMQISVEQGRFMELVTQLIQAKKVLEVGVFTGYSALVVAQALPEEGTLIACDVSEEWTSIGRRYWQEAGVAHKIDLRIAPALQTLDGLLADGHVGTFDFAFIDADKSNYQKYYEEILDRTRPGGLILIDNVIWSGEVLNPANQTADTRAIRELNDFLASDQRVDVLMLPIADGLTICYKK